MFNDIYLIFSFYLRGDKATWSSILFSSEKSKTQLSTNDCQDMGTKICYIVPESGESNIGTYFYIFLDCILISKFIKWHGYMYLIYPVGIKCHENTYIWYMLLEGGLSDKEYIFHMSSGEKYHENTYIWYILLEGDKMTWEYIIDMTSWDKMSWKHIYLVHLTWGGIKWHGNIYLIYRTWGG